MDETPFGVSVSNFKSHHMNAWEMYPKVGTMSEWLPKSVPTDEYRVIYYLGFDRDDWDDMTLKAWSLDHAKERARELVPNCYRIKSVKLVDNQ